MPTISDIKGRSPRWVKDIANRTTRTYAMQTADRRPVPDFMVVGTKRGGTTSMFRYLLMHPGILGLYPQTRGKKGTEYYFRNWHESQSWYRSHFHTETHRTRLARDLGYRPLSGEASPYYMWDPRIASRVATIAPRIKTIMLLRNPVERAWSHYQERVANGVEPLTFPEALEREPSRLEGELTRMQADPGYYGEAYDFYSYRSRGIYLPQAENWMQRFTRDSVLILRSEEMYADVQRAVDRVSDFLGLPRHELPTTRTFNPSTRQSLSDSVRRELTDFYAPHNRALEKYLGTPMQWE